MFTIRRLATLIRKFNNISLLLAASAFVIICAILMRTLEPERFTTFFNAIWYVMTTVTTVGYGDLFPETAAGKVVAMFMFVFGIGLVGVVIGKVVDGLGSFTRRKEEGRLIYKGRKHIIMIGWSKKTEIAVNEVLESDTFTDIIVIAQTDRLPLNHERLHYIQGDPTDRETLLKANTLNAKAAIIFADELIHDASLTDGKSLLIASTIESLAPDVHTTVEIMQEKHIQNFNHIHVNDFILAQETISRLAVRSALSKGITTLYNRLIRRGEEEGGELFEIKPRKEWKTYRDAFNALLAEGATLIADQHRLGVNHLMDTTIPEETRLYVICEESVYVKLKHSEER
ncbi:potassium channel family protein [Paenibacillus swuensis]|uniref:potassium channel family protein n=1 Tax=Paenibacillus swuensis TaxID=1178515 RepID=UPI000AA76384|nr:potassium channel family protein [Paenibacillus swuensis]